MKNDLDYSLDFYDIREDEDCLCNIEDANYCKVCFEEILFINETILLAQDPPQIGHFGRDVIHKRHAVFGFDFVRGQ